MTPTIINAFLGGIRTFFSVWQLCIMQITPFYTAFFLGAYFLLQKKGGKGFLTMVFVSVLLAAGFSIIFGLTGSSSIAAGRLILRNIRGLKFYSGIFILGAGLVMIVLAFLSSFEFRSKSLIVLSPFVGAAIAAGYSPCIAPALSRILNYSSIPGNQLSGLGLLAAYGIGLTSAMTFAGLVFILFTGLAKKGRRRQSPAPAVIASLVFMMMGALLVMGLMLRFKSFLVNLI